MRFYGTRRRGSIGGLAPGVGTIAQLRAIQTGGGIADRTLIFIEDDGAIYAYDRQSSAAESLPDIIAPNAGSGRWILIAGGTPVPTLHVHNKYADISAVVGPRQQILIYDEYEIEDGVTIELLDNSELVIL